MGIFVIAICIWALGGDGLNTSGNVMQRRFIKHDIKKLRELLREEGLYPGVDVYLKETMIQHFISLDFITTTLPATNEFYTERDYISLNIMTYDRPGTNVICELNYLKSVTWLTPFWYAEGFFDYHETFLRDTVAKIKLHLLSLNDDILHFSDVQEAAKYPRIKEPRPF